MNALGQTRVTKRKHLDGAAAYAEICGYKPYWWTNATAKQLPAKKLSEEKRVELLRDPEGWKPLGWNPVQQDD